MRDARPPPGNSRLISGTTQLPYAGPSALWIKTQRNTTNVNQNYSFIPSPQMKRSKKVPEWLQHYYVAFSVTSGCKQELFTKNSERSLEMRCRSQNKQFNSTDSQLSMMYFTISLLPKPTAWWRRVQPKRSWTDRLAPPSSCIWTSWEHEVHEVWQCRALMYDIAGIDYFMNTFSRFPDFTVSKIKLIDSERHWNNRSVFTVPTGSRTL